MSEVPEQLARTSYVPYAGTSCRKPVISPCPLSIWVN